MYIYRQTDKGKTSAYINPVLSFRVRNNVTFMLEVGSGLGIRVIIKVIVTFEMIFRVRLRFPLSKQWKSADKIVFS